MADKYMIPVAKIYQDKAKCIAIKQRLRAYNCIGKLIKVTEKEVTGNNINISLRCYTITEVKKVITKIENKYNKSKNMTYYQSLQNMKVLLKEMRNFKGKKYLVNG